MNKNIIILMISSVAIVVVGGILIPLLLVPQIIESSYDLQLESENKSLYDKPPDSVCVTKILNKYQKDSETASNTVTKIRTDLDRANDFVESGLYEDVTEIYAKVLQIDKKNSYALVGLANIAGETREFGCAEEIYSHVLWLDPPNINAKLGIARLHLLQDKPEMAKQEYEDVLGKDETNVRAKIGLGNSLIHPQIRDVQKAEEIFDAVLRDDEEKNYNAILGKANVYFIKQEYHKAIEKYDEVLSPNPQKIKALEGLVYSYILLGDMESAKTQYDKVISFNPDYQIPMIEEIKEQLEELANPLDDSDAIHSPN